MVDDGEDWRILTRVTLRAAGLVVTGEAASGPEALALIEQLDPAVVALDEKLPGMSGLETARLILDRRPHQTIVLFSAYLDLDRSVETTALRLGIVACLAKLDYRELGRTIEKALASVPRRGRMSDADPSRAAGRKAP